MKGFTLVEILISIFIFSLVFMAMFMLLSGGQASFYTGDAQVELNQGLRNALITMNRELRQTRSTEINGVPADDNFYTSVTFRVPEDVDGDGDVIDASGSMEWSGNINYALNADNQIIRLVQADQSILANNISSLRFRRFAGNLDVIQIHITAQKATALGRSLESSIMSSIKMRN
ncbi:MAG: prepilin-type N-terminal cleavage/methylation domain-containing protein [Candidatus Omnitrophica bacterium]|nr:prepilin-type N-terminal cleavage/methylation domain-containing protein [Candidatus Omnitrophota bacterium]MBU4472713.1 prepilin-type N-terminal cleavage/methylation domain-containing protein [Candidatus Omnitrophota bacterium]